MMLQRLHFSQFLNARTALAKQCLMQVIDYDAPDTTGSMMQQCT
jgi:hypothetical protein